MIAKQELPISKFESDMDKLNDKTRKAVDTLRASIQKEVDLWNEAMFSDDQFGRENALRKWIRRISRNKLLNISDAEDLIHAASKAKRGQVIPFQGTYYIKTSSGFLDRLDRYVHVLELTIIERQTTLDKVTNPGFWGHIKLAFKSLFQGE